MESREYIIKKLAEDMENPLIAVRVFWKSPFGELGMRVGYFEDFCEATEFEVYLSKTYEGFEFPYVTSFRGSTVSEHSHTREVEAVLSSKYLQG